MRRALTIFVFVALAASAALGQFTTVTGTITDPNGLAYAFGTISPALVSSASPTLNGFAYTPPNLPTGLNSAGSFTMRLADNTQLSPGGSTWNFTVSCAAGCVPVAGGKGPVSFTVTGITISGASQSLTATLTAAAPALTNTIVGTAANTIFTPIYPEAYISFVPGTLITQTCSVNFLTVSGARMNADFVVPLWPPALPANVIGMMRISASDTVEIRMCNPTAGSITFGSSLSFGAKLFR
jgi:hypothetical protein